jgi:hypothetical protein
LTRNRGKKRFVLVALASVATLVAAYYGVQVVLLGADGATTRAVAISVQRQAQIGKQITGDPYRYFASYAFIDATGIRRDGRQSVARSFYEAMAGQRFAPAVEVRYSRALPQVNAIDVRALRTAFLLIALLAAGLWAAVLHRVLSQRSAAIAGSPRQAR